MPQNLIQNQGDPLIKSEFSRDQDQDKQIQKLQQQYQNSRVVQKKINTKPKENPTKLNVKYEPKSTLNQDRNQDLIKTNVSKNAGNILDNDNEKDQQIKEEDEVANSILPDNQLNIFGLDHNQPSFQADLQQMTYSNFFRPNQEPMYPCPDNLNMRDKTENDDQISDDLKNEESKYPIDGLMQQIFNRGIQRAKNPKSLQIEFNQEAENGWVSKQNKNIEALFLSNYGIHKIQKTKITWQFRLKFSIKFQINNFYTQIDLPDEVLKLYKEEKDIKTLNDKFESMDKNTLVKLCRKCGLDIQILKEMMDNIETQMDDESLTKNSSDFLYEQFSTVKNLVNHFELVKKRLEMQMKQK